MRISTTAQESKVRVSKVREGLTSCATRLLLAKILNQTASKSREEVLEVG